VEQDAFVIHVSTIIVRRACPLNKHWGSYVSAVENSKSSRLSEWVPDLSGMDALRCVVKSILHGRHITLMCLSVAAGRRAKNARLAYRKNFKAFLFTAFYSFISCMMYAPFVYDSTMKVYQVIRQCPSRF
jgi:hypothetical protein